MKRSKRGNQVGYALIATVGALTVMLIIISGMMSTVAHEVKREREAEMLFRGRQIVGAIARYQTLVRRIAGRNRQNRNRAAGLTSIWPQSLEQLTEGITLPGSTRRVRLLRPSALHDPMNNNGAWKTVSYGDPPLQAFLDAYFEHLGRTMPPQIRLKYLGQTIDFGDEDEDEDGNQREGTTSRARRRPSQIASRRYFSLGQDGDSDDQRTSFLFGVVSQSEGQPIRDYYGLEHYNQWAFVYIPELPIDAGEGSIEMLTREFIFPSDPLVWRMTRFAGGRGRSSVVPGRSRGVKPGGGTRTAPNRGRGGVPNRGARPRTQR